MTTEETLLYIKKNYGDFLQSAGELFHVSGDILAGIMMRETRGGLSSLLSIPGPGGKGDKTPDGVYHGHGLMQIDDRSFPEFCSNLAWSSPEENIKFGAKVLRGKIRFFLNTDEALDLLLEGWDLERLGIASYNAGEGNILKALRKRIDPDLVTAGGNYSSAVLAYAQIYANLAKNPLGGV